MSDLFNRQVSITFGPLGGLGTKVTELRMAFKIDKSREKTPNPGEIKIYNLNPDNRALLEDAEDLVVILEVGYGEVLEHLFTGNIAKAKTMKQGPDFITTIEAGDGEKGFLNGRLDKSYAAGTTYKTMIQDVANSMKDAGEIAIGTLKNVKDEVTQNGVTLSGLSNVLMSKLASKQGLEWNIQDNEFQILGPTDNNGEEAVLLTPDTGLIGKPVKLDKGIDFKSLMNTKIKPGGLVKIESEALNSIVRVNKALFEGDTFGLPFYVTGHGIAV